MRTITDRQSEILAFIRSFFSENKFPPTFRDVSEEIWDKCESGF